MNLPQRKLPRLKNYDYSSHNYYYVTICTAGKRHLFWDHGQLSDMGRMAKEELEKLPEHYTDVVVEHFVVMPNHVHAIIAIGCHTESKTSPTLSAVVGAYKAGVSRRIHSIAPEVKIWQKSFYDSVIRNDQMYAEVWKYIDGNPAQWESNEH